jgi:hypothetical protein
MANSFVRGLQIRLARFDSGSRLQEKPLCDKRLAVFFRLCILRGKGVVGNSLTDTAKKIAGYA